MNSINQDLKQKVHEKYQDILHLLIESQKDLEAMDSKNSDVKKYLTIFKDIFNYSIENAKKRIEDVDKTMIWDRLVVAFFGATNAGKSTIIESLRIKYEKNKKSEDGIIVGTGQPDFTQTFDEYDLDLNATPITIIDMPGIEGNELFYKDKIREALDKAHIILYVQREQTKPDIKTIERIKNYLNDWVKVYSLYNISSFSILPEVDLYSKRNREIAKLIEESFTETLYSTYKGNISIHGLAALCSLANFSPARADLIRHQDKFSKSFNGYSALYEYSKMPVLVDFLKEVGSNYINEIVEANKTRLVAMTKQTATQILEASKYQEERSKSIPREMKKFKSDIKRYFNDCSESIELTAKTIIKDEIRSLKDYIFNLIENKDKDIKKKSESKSKRCMESISEKVENNVNDSLKQLSNKINKRREKLNAKVSLLKYAGYRYENSNDFDYSEVHDLLKIINFDKGLDLFGDIALWGTIGFGIGSVVPGVGNLAGAIVGAVVGVLKWVFLGKNYRNEAKQSISQTLQEAQNTLILEFEKNINDLIDDLTTQFQRIELLIDNEIQYIQAAEKDIKNVCIKLEQLEHKITNNEYGKI